MGETVVRQRVEPTANTSRRTWDDQLAARLPRGAVRAVVRFIRGRSVRSRLRRALMARSLTRGWAAAQREDWACLQSLYADDCEVQIESAAGSPIVGSREGMRGFDAVTEIFDELLEAWGAAEYHVHGLIDAPDWFVGLIVVKIRGSGSGVEVTQEQAYVYDMRDGAITRQRGYFSWRAALEAAGLTDIADELERERKEAASPTTR
ncbi:MAG: nuclear transport factor 2 family protein [Thermoleophilaceae bacterium]